MDIMHPAFAHSGMFALISTRSGAPTDLLFWDEVPWMNLSAPKVILMDHNRMSPEVQVCACACACACARAFLLASIARLPSPVCAPACARVRLLSHCLQDSFVHAFLCMLVHTHVFFCACACASVGVFVYRSPRPTDLFAFFVPSAPHSFAISESTDLLNCPAGEVVGTILGCARCRHIETRGWP